MPDLDGLPGSERIARGLREAGEGPTPMDSVLASRAWRRRADLGPPGPRAARPSRDAELVLYELLAARSADPYYAYLAAVAELDSFLSSLEARR